MAGRRWTAPASPPADEIVPVLDTSMRIPERTPPKVRPPAVALAAAPAPTPAALLPSSPLAAAGGRSGRGAREVAGPSTPKSRKPSARLDGSSAPWIWEDTPEEKDRLRQLYRMIDKDDDGSVSTTELMHMLINLGEDVSEQLVEDMVNLVDDNGDKEISFEEFRAIMTNEKTLPDELAPEQLKDGELVVDDAHGLREGLIERMQERRNRTRDGRSLAKLNPEDERRLKEKMAEHARSDDPSGRLNYHTDEIRHLFNEIDEDGGGTLDKDEVARLADKMGHSVKRRHLVDAMKAMDPEGTGEVSFDMFKNWLIDTGRHWADLLVMPEGSIAEIHETAERLELLPHGPGAKVEWQRLSVLLRLLSCATAHWGKPECMYGLDRLRVEQKIRQLKAKAEAKGQSGLSEADREQLAAAQERLMQVAAAAGGTQNPQATASSQSLGMAETAERERTAEVAEGDKVGGIIKANRRVNLEVIMPLATFAHENEKEAKVMRCFFRPNAAFRTIWDLVQVVLLVYLLISVPLRLSFAVDVVFGSFAFWFDVAVDVYFVADICINFRTPFYDSRGVLEIRPKAIAKEYLKSWFLIDFGTCLPISYVMMIIHGIDSSDEGKSVRALKVLRLLKLAKLLRVTRIIRMLDRYREQLRVFMATFGAFILSFFLMLMAHLIACIWYFIGTEAQVPVGTGPGYDGWVRRLWGPSIVECEAPNATEHWSADPDYSESMCREPTQVTRYMTAVYWALMTISTVGFGDIYPTTDLEKLWAVVTMLFGALVFAAITGSLSARFTSEKGTEQVYNTKMDEVRNYLNDNGIPIVQRKAVEAHYRRHWQNKSIYDEKEILGRLPNSLSTPIVQFLYQDVMGSAALFTQLMDGSCEHGREILSKIALELKHEVANQGVVVMQAGEYGNSMYLVGDGEVEIYRRATEPSEIRLAIGERPPLEANNRVRLGRLGPRGFFGELAVMRSGGSFGGIDAAEATSKCAVRTRTAIARTGCSFHVLEKSALERLRGEYPVLHQVMLNIESGLDRPYFSKGRHTPRQSPASVAAAGARGLESGRQRSAEADLHAQDRKLQELRLQLQDLTTVQDATVELTSSLTHAACASPTGRHDHLQEEMRALQREMAALKGSMDGKLGAIMASLQQLQGSAAPASLSLSPGLHPHPEPEPEP